jgi:formate dehydrogenase major subunit
LHPDGLGWIWVASLKDGALPTHYEPLESLLKNPLYGQREDPVVDNKARHDNAYADSPGDPRYPYILSTYRLTAHHTRTLSHLAELQPELFTEVSPELAAEVGLKHREYATITTPRATIEARVMVTPRLRPLSIDGRMVHQVKLPYH